MGRRGKAGDLPSLRRLHLPFEPLLEHCDNLFALATNTDTHYRQLLRWREKGWIPGDAADLIATRLYLHPTAIWGDAWGAGIDTDEEEGAVA